MIIVDQITQSIQALNPARTCAHTKAQQYYDVVVAELRRGLVMRRKNQTHIPFRIETVKRALGRYGNPQQYWWKYLHNTYPLITVIKGGNNLTGEASMVDSQIPMDVLLASGDAQAITDALYADFDGTESIHTVPINQKTLGAYIQSTQALVEHKPHLQNHLHKAQLIQAVAQTTGGTLPQVVNLSNFGRCYYKGLNLQNVPKVVRHAALGKCWAVDINNSVFQWKMSYLDRSSVQEHRAFTYTRELFDRKNAIREELAQVVWGNTLPHSIQSIKSVLTAISFGARRTGACWFRDAAGQWQSNAIGSIIRDAEHRERLFNNTWFQGFCAEQRILDDMIYQDFRENHTLSEQQLTEVKTDGGKWNRSRTISYAYQQAEAEARNILMTALAPYEILLQVHDCVYVRHEPDVRNAQLPLQNLWPWATLSKEQVDPWLYNNSAQKLSHQDRIDLEEYLSKQISSKNQFWETTHHDDFDNRLLLKKRLMQLGG